MDIDSQIKQAIYDGIPQSERQQWLDDFNYQYRALTKNQTSWLWPNLALWMLKDPPFGMMPLVSAEDSTKNAQLCHQAVGQVLFLFGRRLSNEEPTPQEWSSVKQGVSKILNFATDKPNLSYALTTAKACVEHNPYLAIGSAYKPAAAVSMQNGIDYYKATQSKVLLLLKIVKDDKLIHK